MPDFSGMSDSAGNTGFGGGYNGGGLEGAPDAGTLGGNFSDAQGETSATMGGGLSQEQSAANAGVNSNPYGYDFGAAGLAAPGDFNLGQLFGSESAQGLPSMQGEYAGNESTYGLSDFAQSPFAKALRGIIGMTPYGKLANMGISAAMGESPTQVAANAVPGMAGVATRAGLNAYGSENPTASLGRSALGTGLSTMGSILGSSMAGPVGGMLGGWAGSQVANMAGSGQGGPSNASTGQGQRFNLGNTLQGLGGLYAGYQGMQQAGQLGQNAANTNQALQGQMSSLSNMYAPNSPYAQQLEQQLARKDAASGRLSQYGPRSVELQARLAGMAPQVANSMSGLAQAGGASNAQAQTANTNAQIAKAQMMNKLLGLGQSTGFNQWAGQGLSNMFSSNSAPSGNNYDELS